MGQKPTQIKKQWADGPFKLIESPRKRLRVYLFRYVDFNQANCWQWQITDLKKESGALGAATDMCLAHNMMIRMLNCIYLQAPNVKLEKDIADFATFMHAFLVMLHEHHGNEETMYFPWLEELNGEVKDYMNKNVEQHHGFAPGLQAFEDYVTTLREGKVEYDSAKLISLIDVFATALVEHLHEEIPTFEALDKLEIDWPVWMKKVLKAAVDNAETVRMSSASGTLKVLMFMEGV
jgi:hemerythrin-like domain-containing protein